MAEMATFAAAEASNEQNEQPGMRATCLPCYESRKRCDGGGPGAPCERCVRLNITAECSFQAKRKPGPKKGERRQRLANQGPEDVRRSGRQRKERVQLGSLEDNESESDSEEQKCSRRARQKKERTMRDSSVQEKEGRGQIQIRDTAIFGMILLQQANKDDGNVPDLSWPRAWDKLSPEQLTATDILSLRGQLAAFPSSPNQNRSPAVHRPMHTAQADVLNNWEVNLWLMERYFFESEANLPMLSRALLYARGAPSALLVASCLLFASRVGPYQTPNQNAMDKALWTLASAELSALLDSKPATGTTTELAAICNLMSWVIIRGHRELARQLLNLAGRLAGSPDPQLPPPTSSRLEWLAYWEIWRIRQCIIRMRWIANNLVRNLDAPPTLDMRALAIPALPAPRVWEVAQTEGFDLTTVPPPRLLTDGLMFLRYPSQSVLRAQHLSVFTEMAVPVGILPYWTLTALRVRVDHFIAACRANGIHNPALLPSVAAPTDSPAILKLLARRIELDTTIVQVCSAFPEPIKEALKLGDARMLVSILYAELGNWQYAFNFCMQFPAISMLRLELWTGLGTYMNSGSDIPSLTMDVSALAEPFSHGDLPRELLTEAISYTRLLESWVALNPTFEHHVISNVPLVFQVTCMHAAFSRRFWMNLQTNSLGPIDYIAAGELLGQVERDVQLCLSVLQAYAAKMPSFAKLYLLAFKIVSAIQVTPEEIDEARFRREPTPMASSAGADEDDD